MSEAEETECSYAFDETSDGQPDDAFGVSSTLVYRVDWTCSGLCTASEGTLGELDSPAGTATIRVGERQSVVVRGG